MRLGNFAAAQQAAEAALALSEEGQYTYGLAVANYGLGRNRLEQGQIEAARPFLEQALNWSHTAGDRLVISLVLNSLELVAITDGDYAGALALNQESLDLAWQIKDMWMVSGALREAGNVAQAMGSGRCGGRLQPKRCLSCGSGGQSGSSWRLFKPFVAGQGRG